MASPYNFDPLIPIPNPPFYYPDGWDFYAPPGTVIFGNGFTIDPVTGTVAVTQINPNPIVGTVTNITGGTGIQTAPTVGITVSGSIGRTPVAGLISGTYTNVFVAIDTYGRVTAASSGAAPAYTIDGDYPIYITGAAPNPTVNIYPASTIAPGAVQLVNNLTTNSNTQALTAAQGQILASNLCSITVVTQGQFFAGVVKTSTQLVTIASVLGNGAGILAGSPLPAASAANVEAYVLVDGPGTFTAPDGSVYSVVPGDYFYSNGTIWQHIPAGARPPYATTTSVGVVELATPAEVLPLLDNVRAVTPFSLSQLKARNNQRGLAKYATNAVVGLQLDPFTLVSPSSLGANPATPISRGVIQLDNTFTSTSTTTAPTSNALYQVSQAVIKKFIITANGDLIAGQAAGDPQRLAKGNPGEVLTVDALSPLGLKWAPFNTPQIVPVGTVMWWASNDPTKLPPNWTFADGRTESNAPTSPYYELFQLFGTTYNNGTEPAGDFRLPPLAGRFVRGYDSSGTIDAPGRAFGSIQTSALKQHNHGLTEPVFSSPPTVLGHNHISPSHSHADLTSLPQISTATVTGNDNGLYRGNRNFGFRGPTDDTPSGSTTGRAITVDLDFTNISVDLSPATPALPNESRPINVALNPIIKYSTQGEIPVPPPAPQYYLDTQPSAAGPGAVLTSTVTVVNVPVGTTLYWKYSGGGITPAFFTSGLLTGTVTIVPGYTGTWTDTLAAVLPPGGPYVLDVDLYTDATFLSPVGNQANVIITP